MTSNEFEVLSKQLVLLAKEIPTYWGKVQNNFNDNLVNIFDYNDYAELQKAMRSLTTEQQNYAKRRWFLWQCARCDEHLFCSIAEVKQNEATKDKAWDIEICGRAGWRFDLKGTLVPKQMQEPVAQGINQKISEGLIDFFYTNQSKQVRYGMQNRLFLVHMPITAKNEMALRANFSAKKEIYQRYIKMLKENPMHKFFVYGDVVADLVYIKETPQGRVLGVYGSKEINKESA